MWSHVRLVLKVLVFGGACILGLAGFSAGAAYMIFGDEGLHKLGDLRIEASLGSQIGAVEAGNIEALGLDKPLAMAQHMEKDDSPASANAAFIRVVRVSDDALIEQLQVVHSKLADVEKAVDLKTPGVSPAAAGDLEAIADRLAIAHLRLAEAYPAAMGKVWTFGPFAGKGNLACVAIPAPFGDPATAEVAVFSDQVRSNKSSGCIPVLDGDATITGVKTLNTFKCMEISNHIPGDGAMGVSLGVDRWYACPGSYHPVDLHGGRIIGEKEDRQKPRQQPSKTPAKPV